MKESIAQMLRRWAEEAKMANISPITYALKEWGHSGVFSRLDTYDFFLKLADMIEAEEAERYLPRPLYEDGEPVQFGDVIDIKGTPTTVMACHYYNTGEVYVGDIRCKQLCLDPGDRAKRYEQVLDADGEPINVGDTVWFTDNHRLGIDWKVERIEDGRIDVKRDTGSWSANNPPEVFTHREPDSLERIKADRDLAAREYREKYDLSYWDTPTSHMLDRAIAIMERGA